MVYDTESGEWKNVKNEPLKIPVTREMADDKALVANTGKDWTFQGIVTIDTQGNPHIGMTIGPDIGKKRSGPKRMEYFKWKGSEWIQAQNSGLPVGNGDIALTPAGEIQFYMASQNDEGKGEVAQWDGGVKGDSFQKTKILLTKPNANFAISALIENPHPDAQLIVAERKRGTDYRRMYLLGDNGPITRKTSEAKLLAAKSNFVYLKNAKEWNLALSDTGIGNWKENWTLDGQLATIKNTNSGMDFSEGSEANNDARHPVLWTKDTFAGDIRIEYDYVRTDEQNKYVNILDVQATGTGKGEYATDIAQWQYLRKVPAMRKYFKYERLAHQLCRFWQ